MADQPVAPDSFVNVTTAGSVVVSNTGVALKRIIIPGTFVGSVEFYNSATVAGTAASNNIINIGIPNTNQYRSIDVNASARNGLVYAAIGTPVLTFTWN